MTSPKPITLEEQIEAIEALCCADEQCKKCEVKRAAAATLRSVQKCRDRASQLMDDGVIVAADIEGIVP